MNKFTRFGSALVFALTLTVSAGADEKKIIERKDAKEPTTDQEFVVHALASQIAEIKFAEQALKTTKNEDVRKFAQRMVTDHSKTRDALIERARDLKVAVVEGMEQNKREKLDQLSKPEGSGFDREYMSCMVESHEKAARMWEKWSTEAKDQNLRELAKRTTPVIKEHLEMARELSKKLKG
jgi:putative membrane protein